MPAAFPHLQNAALQGQWFAHYQPPIVEVEDVLDDLSHRHPAAGPPTAGTGASAGDGTGRAAPATATRRLSMLRWATV
jgi:hypothetical protein